MKTEVIILSEKIDTHYLARCVLNQIEDVKEYLTMKYGVSDLELTRLNEKNLVPSERVDRNPNPQTETDKLVKGTLYTYTVKGKNIFKNIVNPEIEETRDFSLDIGIQKVDCNIPMISEEEVSNAPVEV